MNKERSLFQHIRKMNEPSASLLLLLLLSADFIFIVLHIILHTLGPNSLVCKISGLCIHQDVYHLIKLFWIIILLVSIFKSTRYSGYVSWILMFLFFLLDDALLLHQNIGDSIANKFATNLLPKLSLPPRFFELAVLAIAGMVLLFVVSRAYFHGSPVFRKISNDMLLFILAFVFFGLIVDLAAAIKLGSIVIFGLVIVEDGGELVVDSLILWYVFLLALRKGKPDLFLLDLLHKPETQ